MQTIVEPKIKIDSSVIRKYYNQHKKSFFKIKSSQFDLISFDNQQNALSCAGLIEQFGIDTVIGKIKKGMIQGIIKVSKLQKLDYDSINNMPRQEINMLKELPVKKSQILPLRNNFTVFYKISPNLSEPLSFNKSKDKIYETLHQQALDNYMKKKLPSLLNKKYEQEECMDVTKLVDKYCLN